MRKYPKIKYPNDTKARDTFYGDGEIIVQEKLDGGNFRFTLEHNLAEEYQTDGRDIVFGSRNVIYKNQRDERTQFSKPIEYVRQNVNVSRLREFEEEFGTGLTLYGEAMVPHTLEYDWSDTSPFLGFDIRRQDNGDFLRRTEMERIFEQIGLDIAAIVDIVSAKSWDEYSLDVGQSEYGDIEVEGYVFKNYDTQTFAKFVREDFKETNKKTFGASESQQQTDEERMSYQYITNARIEKQVHTAIDEGPWDSIKMEMMGPKNEADWPGVPELVIRDMAEEEAGNLLMEESWEIDISEFRSVTSGRCAAVLKKMVNERQVEELLQ